jgi:hypothetical protein
MRLTYNMNDQDTCVRVRRRLEPRLKPPEVKSEEHKKVSPDDSSVEELNRWKSIAIWFAHCHAANDYHKITEVSTVDKMRYRSILERGANYMRGGVFAPTGFDDASIQLAINRLDGEANLLPPNPEGWEEY